MKNLPFKFFLLVLPLCAPLAGVRAQADNPWEGVGLEGNYFTGKVVRHEAKFTLPIPDISNGFDATIVWKTFGRKEWQQRRRYPVLGLGFTYTNYGIDSIYGRGYSLYPYISIPLVTGKRLEWTLRLGDGIAYVTRPYSRVHPVDTVNVAIGSKLNDYGSFFMDLRYHLNKHWDLQGGVNLSHISDGSFRQPNLGVNLVGEHFGIRYFPIGSAPKRIVRNLKPLKNRWLFQYRLSMGLNASNAPLGPDYPIYLATAYVSRRWKSKNKVFAGFDYSYSRQLYDYLRNNEFVTPGHEAYYAFKTAVFAGNEFLLGRVGVVFQLGIYTHQLYDIQEPYYEKLGANLYLSRREHGPLKEFFLCAFLEAHQAVAEFGEFGFGMGF